MIFYTYMAYKVLYFSYHCIIVCFDVFHLCIFSAHSVFQQLDMVQRTIFGLLERSGKKHESTKMLR